VDERPDLGVLTLPGDLGARTLRPSSHPALGWVTGRWALAAVDLTALVVALLGAMLWMGSPSVGAVAAFPALGIAALAARGAYAPRLRMIVLDMFGVAAGSVSIAAMATLALELLLRGGDPAAPLLFRAWALGILAVGVGRVALCGVHQRLRVRGVTARPTLIVGAGEVGARVARRLVSGPEYGLKPVGFVDTDPPPAEEVGGRPAPVLGRPEDLSELVELLGVEHVILAFSQAPDHALLPIVRRCQQLGVGVSLVPRLFDSINDRVSYEPVGGLPVLTLRSTDPESWQFAVKHGVDRAVAGLLLLLLAPVFAAIALGVKASSPGPIMFRQRRVGRDGHVFDILKFRTMRPDDGTVTFVPVAGSAPGGVEGVDRRTRIGRFLRRSSLDELPQLINVLRGEMSLVGPRPERPEFVQGFIADLRRYDDRHRVRSGITGLSQVHGLRGQTPIADRVELDNYYIENWSLKMDLKIMLLTFLTVLRPAE